MFFCFFSKANYIDGQEFLALSDVEVKEMVTAIGVAKKISRLIPKVRQSFTFCCKVFSNVMEVLLSLF